MFECSPAIQSTSGFPSMPIEFQNQQSQVRISTAPARRALVRALHMLRVPQAGVSVVMVEDEAMRALNREYRGIDRTTDILSFGMREYRNSDDPLPPHPEVLGDLVISMPELQRQAREGGMRVEEEFLFLLLHGLLHLLGYDHATLLERKRMEALHRVLLFACRSPRKGNQGGIRTAA